MEHLSSDTTLSIFSYLSFIDAGKTASTCRRYSYLIYHLHRKLLDPELVATQQPPRQPARTAHGEVVSKPNEHRRTEEIVGEALCGMRSRPNISFAFYSDKSNDPFSFNFNRTFSSNGNESIHDLDQALSNSLPPDTVVLAAQSRDVQCNIGSSVSAASPFGIVLGSFPDATFVPFVLENERVLPHGNVDSEPTESLRELLKPHETGNASTDDESFWSVFFVYVAGNRGMTESASFLASLQKRYPRATIVGGVCESGFCGMTRANTKETENTAAHSQDKDERNDLKELYSKKSIKELKSIYVSAVGTGTDRSVFSGLEKSDLISMAVDATLKSYADMQAGIAHATESDSSDMKFVTDGIFGLAIGGADVNVPVKSVVSLGLKSMTTGNNVVGDTRYDSNTVIVSDAEYVTKSDDGYPLGEEDGQPPVHIIKSVRDTSTGATISPYQHLKSFRSQPMFIGFKENSSGSDSGDGNGAGYTLYNDYEMLTNESSNQISIMLRAENSKSLQGCSFDGFSVDRQACVDDMDYTLSSLKSVLRTKRLLGAIMFSCAGRGPGPIMTPSTSSKGGGPMLDATLFHEYFPNIPCLGFYAGGEIGPQAMAGRYDGGGALTSDGSSLYQSGRVAIQGFTAVFAVFIVPEKRPDVFSGINDSPEEIALFLRNRFKRSVG